MDACQKDSLPKTKTRKHTPFRVRERERDWQVTAHDESTALHSQWIFIIIFLDGKLIRGRSIVGSSANEMSLQTIFFEKKEVHYR